MALVDPNAITLKYSMYMLANTGDNGDIYQQEGLAMGLLQWPAE